MKAMGLDLSLSKTGVAFIDDNGDHWVTLVKSQPVGDDPVQMSRRIVRARNQILTLVRDAQPDVVVIERGIVASAPGKNGKSQTSGAVLERGGLFFHTINGIDTMKIPVGTAYPSTLKKAVTDNGSASKWDVAQALIKLFPGAEFRDDNEADALGAAMMGAIRGRHDQLPFVVSEWRRLAVANAAWPLEMTAFPTIAKAGK